MATVIFFPIFNHRLVQLGDMSIDLSISDHLPVCVTRRVSSKISKKEHMSYRLQKSYRKNAYGFSIKYSFIIILSMTSMTFVTLGEKKSKVT